MRHRRAQAGDLLRRRLRRGHDVDLPAWEVLAEAERDVAGARGHVDDEEVGIVPVDVGEELLERLVEHRAAPDDGLPLRHEVADGDAAHAPLLGGQQHAVEHHRIAIGAEHAWDRVAVDVGVDHADRIAHLGQRHREVGRDAALAHPTLAGGDEERAGLRPRLREGDLRGPRRDRAPRRAGASPWEWPWSLSRNASRSLSVITVKSRPTSRTPGSGLTAPLTRFWISLRSGQPGTVRAISTCTSPSELIVTSRTIPRSTIERCSSGSSTGRSASTT